MPFSFRIIHAELPQYLGKTQESLDRLYYIYAIVQKVNDNWSFEGKTLLGASPKPHLKSCM